MSKRPCRRRSCSERLRCSLTAAEAPGSRFEESTESVTDCVSFFSSRPKVVRPNAAGPASLLSQRICGFGANRVQCRSARTGDSNSFCLRLRAVGWSCSAESRRLRARREYTVERMVVDGQAGGGDVRDMKRSKGFGRAAARGDRSLVDVDGGVGRASSSARRLECGWSWRRPALSEAA